MAEPISDGVVAATLGRFAAGASLVLDDPGEWLGRDPDPGPRHPLVRAASAARGLLTGRGHPGTSGWDALPLERRVDWWVDRIAAVAAPIAATPRVFGVAADRVPLQAAFGTAVAGLTVCAVAREHAVTEPAEWVPLLGKVLFDRDLATPLAADLPTVVESDDLLRGASPPGTAPPGTAPPGTAPPGTAPAGTTPVTTAPESDVPGRDAGLLRRGGRALWRLAQVLLALNSIFDERPRGAWAWRALGKLPIVGLAGGVLDERGAVRKAAEETQELLAAR